MAHRPIAGILLLVLLLPALPAAGFGLVRFPSDGTVGNRMGSTGLGNPTPLEAPQSLVFQPGPASMDDNYLYTGNGGRVNFGVNDTLMVGYWGNSEWNRAVLRFPALPLPSNATLVSADLSLFMSASDQTNGMPVSVHVMTTRWTESGSNWDTRDGVLPWNASGGGGDFDPTPLDLVAGIGTTPGWYTWNVTSAAADWWTGRAPNLGLLIRQADDQLGDSLGRKHFWSSDAVNASARPRLLLTYRVAAPGSGLPVFSGPFPWLLLSLSIVPVVWAILRRKRPERFVPTDLYLIHEDGRLVRRIGGPDGPVQDELAASGMFTLVAQFVRDSFGGTDSGPGELKSLTIDNRAVAIGKGGFLFVALVFDGSAPSDLDRRIAEFLEAIEGAWGPTLRAWDGLRDGLADLDGSLVWFLQRGHRRAHPRPPIPPGLRRHSRS